MNLMDKLERKFGRYAIRGLHKYLVGAYFIGFLLEYLPGNITNYLIFSVPHILVGQVWRLVTWIFCGQSSSIFTILFLLCLIPMGQHLERFLGSFRMNVYLIGGMLITLVGGILVYIVSFFVIGAGIGVGIGIPVYITNYYVLLSIFMALAMCMPDATVNLYFILPIKMKWMLVVYFLELAYELYVYFSNGLIEGLALGSQIIFAIANLFLFFHFSKIRLTRKQKKHQKEFRAQFSEPRPGANISRHKCAICGRTEKDDPSLTFRYCSKCTGNKEYCQEHLFTHTHI